MAIHFVFLLGCILSLQVFFLDLSQSSDLCVFGTDPECFYQCHCQFSNCSVQHDPNCKLCYELTGICIRDPHACKFDTLLDDIYYTRYWRGEACQKGNIAAGKLYSVEGSFLNLDPHVGGASDGTLNWYVAFYISAAKHVAVLHLEGTYMVEFIDIFLVSEDLPIADLLRFITVKLTQENGSFSECVYNSNPTFENRLKQLNPATIERLQWQCDSPSIGTQLEVIMQGQGFSIYEVHVYEIVIVGHRFADVNTTNCLKIEGDSEINWCSECQNTLPPECKQGCPDTFTGINCKDVIQTTVITTELEGRYSVLPL